MSSSQSSVSFEGAYAIVRSNISLQEQAVLEDANAKYLKSDAHWDTYALNKNEANAIQARASAHSFNICECQVAQTLSALKVEALSPVNSSRNLNIGIGNESIKENLQALDELQALFNLRFTETKQHLGILSKQSTQTSSSGEESSSREELGESMQTKLVILNQTQGLIAVSANIANSADWGSTENRPDKNLVGKDGGDLEIGSGILVERDEVVNDQATSAIFTLNVKAFSFDGEHGLPQTFNFNCNQRNAITAPVLSPDETGLPEGVIGLSIYGEDKSDFMAYQQSLTGEKTVVLTLVNNIGGL